MGTHGNRINIYGILPTPDPTIASCISDEDVAMQLIRLGDASNFSHGRTSLSTADDAFSGVADASSSTGATSDGEAISASEDGPSYNAKELEHEVSGLSSDGVGTDYHTEAHLSATRNDHEFDPLYDAQATKAKRAKYKSSNPLNTKTKQSTLSKSAKVTKARSGTIIRKNKTVPTVGNTKILPPPAPSSMNGQSARKLSSASSLNFQHQLAADEEDLSTKPRCQRCRKSKKGCDRQRPCQRCKDAGIGAEGCISEDEGNGRKGRYGRHMGVPIKKVVDAAPGGAEIQPFGPPPVAIAAHIAQTGNKKRKR